MDEDLRELLEKLIETTAKLNSSTIKIGLSDGLSNGFKQTGYFLRVCSYASISAFPIAYYGSKNKME